MALPSWPFPDKDYIRIPKTICNQYSKKKPIMVNSIALTFARQLWRVPMITRAMTTSGTKPPRPYVPKFIKRDFFQVM
jgi:hypothetical protein